MASKATISAAIHILMIVHFVIWRVRLLSLVIAMCQCATLVHACHLAEVATLKVVPVQATIRPKIAAKTAIIAAGASI